MENTKITKKATVTKNTKKGEVVMEKKATKKVNTKKAVVEKTEVVENKKKETKSLIQVMDNNTLKKLFNDNGCLTRTNASNSSNVVYNTFGTQSRVLQQKRAYQLLLTNGHADKKGTIVNTDNDDTLRFLQWVGTLDEEQKKFVIGADTVMSTKLSASEMPRERTAKITSYELLVAFIQYMATFDENKLAVTE